MTRPIIRGVECTCVAPPPQPEGPHEERCAIAVNDRMLSWQDMQPLPPPPPPEVPPAPDAGVDDGSGI